MSTIRKELNPTGDISRNLEETLRKNGMEAHLREVGDSYQLLVMSHDSPQITYDISREDALKMMNGGSHASDKKAYNTSSLSSRMISMFQTTTSMPRMWAVM